MLGRSTLCRDMRPDDGAITKVLLGVWLIAILGVLLDGIMTLLVPYTPIKAIAYRGSNLSLSHDAGWLEGRTSGTPQSMSVEWHLCASTTAPMLS